MSTPKDRLFICGDSFVDWDIPTYHWTDYLKEHYDVYNFGERGSDNISILLQLGNIPTYKTGDRIIVYWTDPSRFQKLYWGDHKPLKLGRWWDTELLHDKDRLPTLQKIKVDRASAWESNKLKSEVTFFKKIKELFSNYNPIFVTWNSAFHSKTNEFVDLIQTSTLSEENSNLGESYKDRHPGPNGCYDIYKILLNKLDKNKKVLKIKKNLF